MAKRTQTRILSTLLLSVGIAAGLSDVSRAYKMGNVVGVFAGGGVADTVADKKVKDQGATGGLFTVGAQYGLADQWSVAASFTGFDAGGGNYHPGMYNVGLICDLFTDKSWTPVFELGMGLGAIHRGANWRPLGVKAGGGLEYFFNDRVSVRGMAYYLGVMPWDAGDPGIHALSGAGLLVLHWGVGQGEQKAGGEGAAAPAETSPAASPAPTAEPAGAAPAVPAAAAPDDDHDGVPNAYDFCPGTPPGTPVDGQGCPKVAQQKPAPATNAQPAAQPASEAAPAVPAPPAAAAPDDDHDGVPNSYDFCPGTPPGTPVDGRGCPKVAQQPAVPSVPDSDGDGVVDTKDECPGTPPGTPVDDKGCPKR